jgi:hypothetical protein
MFGAHEWLTKRATEPARAASITKCRASAAAEAAKGSAGRCAASSREVVGSTYTSIIWSRSNR